MTYGNMPKQSGKCGLYCGMLTAQLYVERATGIVWKFGFRSGFQEFRSNSEM